MSSLQEILEAVAKLKESAIPPVKVKCSVCGKEEEVYYIGSGALRSPHICDNCKADEPKLVYLEWSDASSHSGWQEEDKMKEFAAGPGYVVHEVGWIYEEDDTKIVLYGQYHEWSEGGREYGNCQYIPKPG